MAKSLKAAAKSFNQGRWDDPIKDELFTIPPKSTRIRFFSEIITVRQHWVEFYSEKKKAMTGYFDLCLDWDPTTDESTGGGCPYCEAKLRYTEYHYAYVISRSEQAKAKMAIVHPIRLTAKIASAVVKLSDIVYEGVDDAPDATDVKGGFDVFIRSENTNGKVEYHVSHGDKTPLTAEEREAFKEYVAEKNIGKMAKAGTRPYDEIARKLSERGVEGGGDKDSGAKKPLGTKPKPKAKDYEKYDEEVPNDEDDPASPPARPGKAPKPDVTKKTSLTGDDEEEEAPAPRRPAAKPAAKAPASKKPLPWEDEEEAPSKSYVDADEEDAPADEEE